MLCYTPSPYGAVFIWPFAGYPICKTPMREMNERFRPGYFKLNIEEPWEVGTNICCNVYTDLSCTQNYPRYKHVHFTNLDQLFS